MDKQIKLLKNQINKLESPEFDLEAWKAATSALLIRMLGKNDPRVEHIRQLKIDYGSWALRDAKASYNPTESNKKQGKEILEVVIAEIEAFGTSSANGSIKAALVREAVESEFKAAHLKSIRTILKAKDDNEAKLKKLTTKLKSIGEEVNAMALAKILVDGNMGEHLD